MRGPAARSVSGAGAGLQSPGRRSLLRRRPPDGARPAVRLSPDPDRRAMSLAPFRPAYSPGLPTHASPKHLTAMHEAPKKPWKLDSRRHQAWGAKDASSSAILYPGKSTAQLTDRLRGPHADYHLAVVVDFAANARFTSLLDLRVVHQLGAVTAICCRPRTFVSANGPELTSIATRRWSRGQIERGILSMSTRVSSAPSGERGRPPILNSAVCRNISLERC
jgi:hypothetical protein